MPYEEYRHPFVGPTGHAAVCHVRVYRPGAQVIAVICELDDNPGASVTNAAEIVASEIWTLEGRPSLDRFTVVEHYPPFPGPRDPRHRRRTAAGDFDRVLLALGDGQLHLSAGRWRREVFRDVTRWQHLELAELEALIGEPWTPIPGANVQYDV